MYGISKGIKDRGDLGIDTRPMLPDVSHRQGNILSKRSRAVDSHTLCVAAQMPASCQAVAAMAADDVAFAADDFAGKEVYDVGPDLDDFADELMADDQWQKDSSLCPGIPLIDVQVGPADPSLIYPDEYVIDTN